jgi:hypothetical protein
MKFPGRKTYWEAPRPEGRGLPGKEDALFKIASLHPALKGEAFGKHSGKMIRQVTISATQRKPYGQNKANRIFPFPKRKKPV